MFEWWTGETLVPADAHVQPAAPPFVLDAAAEVPLLDAAGARAGDEAAVAAGDRWDALMERAGGHLARGVLRMAGRSYGTKVVILVGKGNNGGDGWVAARRLRAAGASVRIVATHGPTEELSAESAANRDRWLGAGGWIGWDLTGLDAAMGWADVAVDCLLGTGASGAPRGAVGQAVDALRLARTSGLPIVACDIPSGVDADDGSLAGEAVAADLTVTFGGCKRGLLLHPGATHAGTVVVGDLGPHYTPPATGWAALTARGAAPSFLGAAADKVARGRVLVVAGAVGTSGAAALCGAGALAAGAGLVTVAVPAPVRAEVAAHHPAAMVHGLPADDGAVAEDAVDALPDLDGFDAVVAGPGLGHGAGAAAVVAHLRRHANRLVLDADALNVHRDEPSALADHAGSLVLTPHARELARIGGGDDGDDAWAHRVVRVPELAARHGAVLVAKGPGTIVASPSGRVWVTPNGGPSLGSGGTGDVLAGVIAAAIARVPATDDKVALEVAKAVWWHAAAGGRAGADRAERATAVDLLDALPRVLGDLQRAAVHGFDDGAWS